MKKEHTRCLREGWAIIVGGPMAFLVLLFPLLIGCGSTTTPSAKSMTTITLGLPAQALASPTVGSLPGATLLGVRLTLKPSRDTKSGANNLSSFLQRVQMFFRGAKRVQLSSQGTYLAVDASATVMEAILKTHFVLHRQASGRVFYVPAQPPSLPTFLAERLVAITGLDNYGEKPQHLSRSLLKRSPRKQLTASAGAANCVPISRTLPPRSVASAYGHNQLWNAGFHGEGMTVNLVEIDTFDQNDLANYLSCIGFSGPTPAWLRSIVPPIR